MGVWVGGRGRLRFATQLGPGAEQGIAGAAVVVTGVGFSAEAEFAHLLQHIQRSKDKEGRKWPLRDLFDVH